MRSLGRWTVNADPAALLGSIARATDGLRVTPPTPPGRRPRLAGSERPCGAGAPGRASGFALFIEYHDADGVITERRITCRRLERGESRYIRAFCHERGAPRLFRADRILAAVCVSTGEDFDPARLFDELAARGLPVGDPRLAKCLTVLAFLMRCDGWHPAEAEVLERAVERFVLRFEGSDAMYEEGRALIRSLAPAADDFLRALRFIAQLHDSHRISRFVIEHAAQVVDADGTHSPEEIRHALMVGEYLKRLAKG